MRCYRCCKYLPLCLSACVSVCLCVSERHRQTVWKYLVSSTSAPLILSALCKARPPQGQPISDYPTWLAALSVATGDQVSVTSGLIEGDLGLGAGSEVTEDQRREMLAYDWFMSDSLTQSAIGRVRGGEQRVKVSVVCCIGLVALETEIGFVSIRICIKLQFECSNCVLLLLSVIVFSQRKEQLIKTKFFVLINHLKEVFVEVQGIQKLHQKLSQRNTGVHNNINNDSVLLCSTGWCMRKTIQKLEDASD